MDRRYQVLDDTLRLAHQYLDGLGSRPVGPSVDL
jgi:hypothetical protein